MCVCGGMVVAGSAMGAESVVWRRCRAAMGLRFWRRCRVGLVSEWFWRRCSAAVGLGCEWFWRRCRGHWGVVERGGGGWEGGIHVERCGYH